MDPIARFEDIDWARWRPGQHATLLFVVRGAEILLIRKKRGLGAGKINAPGGRIEAGESALDCALRELEEELRVRARAEEVAELGELSFQFVDGYSIHVHVYLATDFDGTPIETDEAIPLWTPRAELPYDEMWADDILWLPHVLDGHRIDGRYIFDGDEVYSGPHANKGPDLLLVPENGYDMKGRVGSDNIVGERRLQGMHTWDNAFFFSGRKDLLDPEETFDIVDVPWKILRSLDVEKE